MALEAQNSALVAGASQEASAVERVRVLSQFRLPGRDDPQPDEVLDIPRGLALELRMYGRVEILDAESPPPAKPAKKGKQDAQ